MPNGVIDCIYIEHSWTDEQAKRFFVDGTLPLDWTTIPVKTKCLMTRIFDATDNPSGSAAEGSILVKLHGSRPDFKTYPASCVFDVGLEDDFIMIPSAVLEMVLMEEEDKAKFIFREGAAKYL